MFNSVRFGSIRFNSVRFGSVRFGSVRFGSVGEKSSRVSLYIIREINNQIIKKKFYLIDLDAKKTRRSNYLATTQRISNCIQYSNEKIKIKKKNSFVEYETVEFESEKSFDQQIWSSLESGHLIKKDLNNDQLDEYCKLNQYSENIISEIFKTIDALTSLRNICKTSNGYTINRLGNENKWIVKININDAKVEIYRSI